MDLNVYSVDDTSNEQIKNHVKQHESFTLIDIKHMSETIRTVEKIIEDNGLKCRVSTNMRAGIAGVAAIGGAWGVGAGIGGSLGAATAAAIAAESTFLIGAASAVGVGIHRLATFNPDYEISKDYFGNSLVVTYSK